MNIIPASYPTLGVSDSFPNISSLSHGLKSCLPLLKIAALVALVATAIWKVYNYFYPSSQPVAALPNWDSNIPSDCCSQIDAAIAANGGYEKWRNEAKHSYENAYYAASDQYDDVRAYYVLTKALESENKELAFRHLKHANKHFNIFNPEIAARVNFQQSQHAPSLWSLLFGS